MVQRAGARPHRSPGSAERAWTKPRSSYAGSPGRWWAAKPPTIGWTRTESLFGGWAAPPFRTVRAGAGRLEPVGGVLRQIFAAVGGAFSEDRGAGKRPALGISRGSVGGGKDHEGGGLQERQAQGRRKGRTRGRRARTRA